MKKQCFFRVGSLNAPPLYWVRRKGVGCMEHKGKRKNGVHGRSRGAHCIARTLVSELLELVVALEVDGDVLLVGLLLSHLEPPRRARVDTDTTVGTWSPVKVGEHGELRGALRVQVALELLVPKVVATRKRRIPAQRDDHSTTREAAIRRSPVISPQTEMKLYVLYSPCDSRARFLSL